VWYFLILNTVSIPLRGKGMRKDWFYGYLDSLRCVSIPLRGKGMRKVKNMGEFTVEEAFQSPCGVKVCGKFFFDSFTEMICVVSIPLRGKGMRKAIKVVS